MHSPVMCRCCSRLPLPGLGLLAAVIGASALSAQTPVDGVTAASGAVARAQMFIQQGQRDSATELLGRHLSQEPNDGRAWFYLGRIYLAEEEQWHRSGHPPEVSSASLLDFASTSFEPAQELLTDSGGVFRVVVAVERATLRIEGSGWQSMLSWELPAEDLPLPPVLAELGRNLLASCPKDGVLLTGSLTELVAAWGLRLQGNRSDLILLRPDLYRVDALYRAHMAPALGADSAAALSAALAIAAHAHPVCLAPGVDSIAGADITWHPSRLALISGTSAPALAAPLSIFHYARTGLAGSVWTAAVRDVYDLAARRNRALCSSLFVNTDALTLPAIPACSP